MFYIFAQTLSTTGELGLLTGAGAVIVFLFRMTITSKDNELKSHKENCKLLMEEKERQKKEIESLWKSNAMIARDAVTSAEQAVNYYRMKYENKPPLPIVKPVITESNSPSTEVQRETARIATLREKMVNLKDAMGFQQNPEPPQAQEKE